QLRGRDPGPAADDLRDHLGVDRLREQRALRLRLGEQLLRLREILLRIGKLPVADGREAPEVALALPALGLLAERLDPELAGADRRDQVLLALPAGAERARALVQVGELGSDRLDALL